MDSCGIDVVCGVLTYFFGEISPQYLPHLQFVFYASMFGGTFVMGSVAGRNDKEGFVNGIMYYINVQVYNNADIPYSIDENAEKHIVEAKRRLGEKIKPRVPS